MYSVYIYCLCIYLIYIHACYMYILHICTHTSGLPCCPDRNGSRMRPLVLSMFELSMSVICQLCLYMVYTCALRTCLLGRYLQFCYWLDLGM